MAERVHDPSNPITVKNGQYFRIRTRRPHPQAPNVRVKGQDTIVEIVLEDGSVVICPHVQSASWRVDSRGGYCTGEFVVHGVVMDVEGTIEDEAIARLEGENARLARLVASLKEELEDQGSEPEPA